jgi:ADP-ribosylglycohydrolase
MTLFTAEGLLDGWAAGCDTGSACLVETTRRAYLRWLLTQDEQFDALEGDTGGPMGGLLSYRALHSRRSPGATCLAALSETGRGRLSAGNDRKGCGGVMRVAPAGLFLWRPDQAGSLRPAFDLGARLAGITHGHPTGQLAAGTLALMVLMLVDGASVDEAIAAARRILLAQPGHEETLRALDKADMLGRSSVPRDVAVAALGQGWIAEEALGIAVYCALVAESFEDGVVLAVNHDGDSDSTGAVAGNLLGAMHGVQSIPARWLEPLELRDLIAETAERLLGYWGPPD